MLESNLLKCPQLKKAQWLAIGIIVLFGFISIVFVFPSWSKWNNANNKLNQPREYNLTLGNIMNIVKGEEKYNITWQIDLTIRQPHSTLITGDRVEISGIAYAETPANFDIIDLSVWFQNSEPYNLTVDENGMLNYNESTVHLNTPDSNKLVGNASIKWELEGTYRPIGQMLFKNETGTHLQYLGVSPEIAITVYPESEYAQTVTSNVTMILAEVAYGLTLVGTGSLILSLWDRSKNNNSNSKNDETKADITDKKPKRRTIRKPNKNRSGKKKK